MLKTQLIVISLFFSGSLFAGTVHFQRTSGAPEVCGQRAVLQTESKQGRLSKMRFIRDLDQKSWLGVPFQDANVIFYAYHRNDRNCIHRSLLKKTRCGQFKVDYNSHYISGKFVASTGGDAKPDPYDDYGLTGYPMVNARILFLSSGSLTLESVYGIQPLIHHFDLDNYFWTSAFKMLKSYKCLYEKTTL